MLISITILWGSVDREVDMYIHVRMRDAPQLKDLTGSTDKSVCINCYSIDMFMSASYIFQSICSCQMTSTRNYKRMYTHTIWIGTCSTAYVHNTIVIAIWTPTCYLKSSIFSTSALQLSLHTHQMNGSKSTSIFQFPLQFFNDLLIRVYV